MSYKITCPYCFQEFNDDEVHFRSEKVNQEKDNPIPAEYDDVEDFKAKYRGEDKENILRKYAEWEFFTLQKDPIYESFWNEYNGTTEEELKRDDQADDIQPYLRKVINPSNDYHRKFLKQQEDGSYFKKDEDNLVTMIVLNDDEGCTRRVCPHCHNPLPEDYGKFPTKFITVIGITGAGKTVYMQQLLKDMSSYTAKVGLTAQKSRAQSVTIFTAKNEIKVGKPLPVPTNEKNFQQPLYYEVTRNIGHKEIRTETFVLYDVGGENFKEGTPAQHIEKYVPFLKQADGIIMLIDPRQFAVFQNAANEETKLQEMIDVVDVIKTEICTGKANKKCETPFAVCISKADMASVQAVFEDRETLKSKLVNDVFGEKMKNGLNRPVFNAKDYNPLAMELHEFFLENENPFVQMLNTTFTQYTYFAFTALGCDVEEEKDENGVKSSKPCGPIIPKRIEEPLLWLLHKFGYIDSNEKVFNPADLHPYCPRCGSDDVDDLPADEQDVVTGWLFKKRYHYEHKCLNPECGHMW